MLSSVSLVFSASLILGQAGLSPAPAKELAAMEPYIGKWVGVVTVDEDVPPIAKAGDQVPISLVFSWTENGRGITGQLETTIDNNPVAFGNAFYTWDPRTKKIVFLDTSLDGKMSHGEVTTQNGNLVFTYRGSAPDGTNLSSTITYVPLTKDSFRAQITNRKEGDKTLPDTTPLELARVER